MKNQIFSPLFKYNLITYSNKKEIILTKMGEFRDKMPKLAASNVGLSLIVKNGSL